MALHKQPFGSNLGQTLTISIHSLWTLDRSPCSMAPWCDIMHRQIQQTSYESPWIFGLALRDTMIPSGNWKACSTTMVGTQSLCRYLHPKHQEMENRSSILLRAPRTWRINEDFRPLDFRIYKLNLGTERPTEECANDRTCSAAKLPKVKCTSESHSLNLDGSEVVVLQWHHAFQCGS